MAHLQILCIGYPFGASKQIDPCLLADTIYHDHHRHRHRDRDHHHHHRRQTASIHREKVLNRRDCELHFVANVSFRIVVHIFSPI